MSTRRLTAALKHCHSVLLAADAIIDPEVYPALHAKITAILRPCDEADHCPTLLPTRGNIAALTKEPK